MVTANRRLLSSSALLPSLRAYQARWLSADMSAALALLVIAVPEQLATSRLAGMPPITGYYAFIAGSALFALLGSNPWMSVGADSTIAPIFAAGVAHFAPLGSARYTSLVGLLAVMVGVVVAAVGLLRLGWVAELLSAPIITGFLAGVAVIIVVHQLPDFLGFASPSGTTVHRIGAIVSNLGATNGWALGTGLAVLVLVVGGERLSRRLPGALVALIGSTAVVGGFGLRGRGVAVLGHFAHGAPRFGLHGLSLSSLGDLAPLAGVVALVVISQSAATTRAFPGPAEGHRGGDEASVSRDFLGVGAGSVVAGLAGSFPVDASPPRTAVVASAGGRSQLSGLAAAVILAALVPAAGLLKDVPRATLAAVLLIVASRIFRGQELYAIARFDLLEAGLATITLLTVALVGVEQGMGLAVVLAMLDRARRTARPRVHVLGRVPGTTSWVPLSSGGHPAEVPGVLVLLFATPLWYANANQFREQLDAARLRAASAPRALVLDAIGMSDIDYTGSRSLSSVLDELEKAKITFAIARAGERVRTSLARSGLLSRIGEERLFASVDEAVRALAPSEPIAQGASP
jgi:SulP family sulfate permease